MKTGGDVVVVISWDVAPAHADARALPRPRLLVSVAVACPSAVKVLSAIKTHFVIFYRRHLDARLAGAREELVQGDA